MSEPARPEPCQHVFGRAVTLLKKRSPGEVVMARCHACLEVVEVTEFSWGTW